MKEKINKTNCVIPPFVKGARGIGHSEQNRRMLLFVNQHISTTLNMTFYLARAILQLGHALQTRASITLILLLITCSIHAQQGNVFVKSADNGTVQIKYFGEKLIYPEGFNIYRSEKKSAEWLKLNNEPLKIQQKLNPELAETDSIYKGICEFALELSKQTDKLDSAAFLLAVLATHAIENNDIAKFLGIYFNDTLAVKKKEYTYKITVLENGKENLLGVSKAIKAGKTNVLLPPGNFMAMEGDKSVAFRWQMPDTMYYAFHLYKYEKRRAGEGVRINRTPILISRTKDNRDSWAYPDVYFSDNDVENDVLYYYELTGIDAFGRESAPTKRFTVMPKDKTFPPAPYGLVIAANKNAVSITWKAFVVKDLKGFNVYRSVDDSIYTKINEEVLNESGLQYIDKLNNPELREYFYKVSSIDRAGHESFSDYVSTVFLDEVPPATPTNFKSESGADYLKIEWDRNREGDLMGYRVYKRTAKTKGKFMLLTTPYITDNFYVDSIAPNSKDAFDYKITALDTSFNNSRYTAPLTVEITDKFPPQVPFIKEAHVEDGSIKISWLSNTETDFAGYNLYRENLGDWQKMNSSLLIENQFTDSDITPAQEYSYALSAVDKLGNESAKSNTVAAMLNKKTEATPKATAVKAEIDKTKGAITLSWQLENVTYSGAVVYRRSEYEQEYKPVSELLTEQAFTDNKLKSFTRYYYKVVTYNQEGESIASDPVFVTP